MTTQATRSAESVGAVREDNGAGGDRGYRCRGKSVELAAAFDPSVRT